MFSPAWTVHQRTMRLVHESGRCLVSSVPAPMPRAALLFAAGLVLLASGPAIGQSCSQLRSCAETIDSLRRGNRGIDGESDGIPCERTLCEGYRPSGAIPRATPAAAPVRTLQASPAASGSRTAAPRPASAPAARLVSGAVVLVSVGDGDTIRVRASGGELVTVRLACIDAPETAQGQPGADATSSLQRLVGAGRLELRPQTLDRYGRTVAEVFSAGRNVNLEMVRTGAAFVYRKYLRDCNDAAYEQAEQQAQRFRQGVWRWDQGVVRPWDFRDRRRD